MELLKLALVVFVALLVFVKPVQWAAAMMGAERTGFLRCLLSLIAASILQTLGLTVPVYGNLVAFLLASAGFSAILSTTFLRGIGIAVLHAILAAILFFVLTLVFGATALARLGL